MTKLEILNEIKNRRLETAKILDKIQVEERKATNVETITLESLAEEIKNYELEAKQLETRSASNPQIVNEKKVNSFGITSVLRGIKDGNLNPELLKSSEQNKLQMRSVVNDVNGFVLDIRPVEQRSLTSTVAAGVDGMGAEIVSNIKLDLLTPLKNNLIFAKAGATYLENLKQNVSFVSYSGSTAYWKGEGESMVSGLAGNAFSEIEFSPKSVTVMIPVTELALIQDTFSMDAKIIEDMQYQIMNEIEKVGLSTFSGSTTKPAGIFADAKYSVTGSTSWDKIVALETATNTSNATVDSMKYIISPATLGKLKTTAKAANTASFIAEGSQINGYNYLVSNNLPTIGSGKGVIFGNFRDFYVTIWDKMSIDLDKRTGYKDGIYYFSVRLWVDFKPLRKESFAKGWLA